MRLTFTAWLVSHALAQQFVMYTAGGDDKVVERADPIISPGKLSQHVHQIFGSNAFAPGVSYDSLQNADCTTVGDASGNGNGADKSIYWHPALFMEASDGSGYIRVPTARHKLYYKDAGTGTKREPFEFPQGFRMLAGNPFMRAPATDVQQQNITQWICHSNGGTNQGTAGGFPTGVSTCDADPGFNGAVHFPHCWNGKDFDQSNPTAHISYPTGDIENGECPSSHPIRLPHIFIENQFDVDSVASRVKQDSFVLAMGDVTGYGWHADFFNGWDDGAIPGLLDSCPQGTYGNQDVGGCPTFQKFSKPMDSCQLKTTYVEKVTEPGQNLPGCNPPSDKNPAPYYETAPLGTYSSNCKLLGAGPPAGGPSGSPSGASSAGTPPMSSGPSMPSGSGKSQEPSMHASSSTLVTSVKASSPAADPTSSAPSYLNQASAISCPSSNHKVYNIDGKKFRVQCGTDHSGGDMKSVTAHSLAECVAACAATDGCVDVSLSGVACYMKSALGERHANSGVNGARLVRSGGSGAATKVVTVPGGAHRRDIRHLHAHAHGGHMRRGSF